VVRLQSDRVGRRPPGSRYEDRTFGRDADERESTAQRGPCPSISCTTPESVSPSIATASRRSATGTTSSGSTWAAVSNSFSPHAAGAADQHDERPVRTQPGAVERGRDLVRADDPDAVARMSQAWSINGAPRCRGTTGAAHRSGRLALDVAARRLAGVRPSIGTFERLLAQEMASATGSLGGTGPAMIGPGTAGPLSRGGGEGWRPSDTHVRRVQDRPRTVFA
jgi:hypothetical protein